MLLLVMVMTWALLSSVVHASTLCPDGSYVSGGVCRLAPDGKYVSGNRSESTPIRLAPDGKYVGEEGEIILCPNGAYAAGRCQLQPNGTYGR